MFSLKSYNPKQDHQVYTVKQTPGGDPLSGGCSHTLPSAGFTPSVPAGALPRQEPGAGEPSVIIESISIIQSREGKPYDLISLLTTFLS